MYRVLKRIDAAHDDGIWTVAWTSSNKILSGSVDEAASIWSGEDLEVQSTLRGHRLGVVSVTANSAGTMAYASSIDSVIRFWDIESGTAAGMIEAGPVEVALREGEARHDHVRRAQLDPRAGVAHPARERKAAGRTDHRPQKKSC